MLAISRTAIIFHYIAFCLKNWVFPNCKCQRDKKNTALHFKYLYFFTKKNLSLDRIKIFDEYHAKIVNNIFVAGFKLIFLWQKHETVLQDFKIKTEHIKINILNILY